jgi:hypothetical protein
MPHDPAPVAEVRGWLSKASKDLAAAQYELRADPPFSEDIVFHSRLESLLRRAAPVPRRMA